MSLPAVPHYELIEELGTSLNSRVYKAISTKNSDDYYTVKLLKRPIRSKNQQRHLKQQIERLKIIHDPRVILPQRIEFKGDYQYIVRQFYSGMSLKQFIDDQQDQLSISQFFTIACELSLAISSVHEAGIVHGGIKPHNILIKPQANEIRLVDFLNPTSMQEISNFIYDKDFVENTLAYTSPEQTGRINHRVEFATDIYSLGIIFYQLLTGTLPFISTDPLELIHSHLAQEAPSVHEVNPDIPLMISKIIAKMCLKEPEKRYQSCMGLYADLHQCEVEYNKNWQIKEFSLGLQDQTRRVIFISKMMGRKYESKIILDEYSKVATGSGFKSIFISGLPGIGKTRLIQELQRPLVSNKGYFTSGKFDQYQKNIPYSSLIQALRNHIRTLLTESDDRVNEHKKRILIGLGEQAKVITDAIPELTILLGEQPEVADLPPVEARNRFNNLLGAFLTSISNQDNSLILFIDDLQWCDSATFEFLKYFFANSDDYPHLFFIGAYRDNEVDLSHPLVNLLNKIKEDNKYLKEISLGPLSNVSCHEMVAYILELPLKQTEALSSFLSELSEGNPLFVSESLSWLHNEKLLSFSEVGQWLWDMDKIRKSNMPKSVVDMFGSKVSQLEPDTLEIIKICACMGNRFLAEDVALICDVSLPELFKLLKPVLTLGLLIENKTTFQFVHDRVQEAVLRLILNKVRTEIHWKVGRHLLSKYTLDERLEYQDDLFTIAAHLNLGLPENIDNDFILELAQINLYAGNKALRALATNAANEYYGTGLELLEVEHWKNNYQLMYRLHQQLAKTELMCGRYEQSELLLNELLERSTDDLDRAEALAEQTTSLSSIGNFIKAIDVANKGLEFFDKQIPVEDDIAHERMEDLLKSINSKGKNIWSNILNMPFTEQRKSKIELSFYSELIPDLYMSGMVPQLYLSAAQSTLHCLEGGMDESVIYSFSIMGLNFGTKGQFDLAFQYEDLAHDLCARYPDTFGATRGINGIVWCNMHSRSHPRKIVEYAQKGIRSGKNCGDLYNAGLSYGPLMWNMEVQGVDFTEIEDIAKECFDFSKKNSLHFSVGLAEAVLAGWVEPMKGISSDTYSIADKLNNWKENNYVAAAGSYYVLRAMSHYYFGRYKEAHDCLEKVQDFIEGMTDNVLKRQWYVFNILTALRYDQNQESNKDKQLRLKPLLEQVEIWAELGPLLKPYLALCRAEWNRCFTNSSDGCMYYLEAIEIAREQDYIFLDGFINELFANLMTDKHWVSGNQYLKVALTKYRNCGCIGKEAQLLKSNPEQLTDEENNYQLDNSNIEMEFQLSDLDVDYLVKSTLALSAERDQDELLTKIATVLLECSGAQNSYLLEQVSNEWLILSESHIHSDIKINQGDKPVIKDTQICQGIVNFVARTREPIVLDDALMSEEFKNLPEIKEYSIRSLMCVPVLHQSKLIGILYLENRLQPKVFNAERVKMIELLSLQMAISIENARLLTEQKMQQQLLQRSQKMEALGKLTGGIAHDYNNMLGVVLGYASLLKESLKNEPTLENFVDQIKHAGERSANLTKKLLSFSRHSATTSEELFLNESIRNISVMLKKILTARIDLIHHLSDDIWPVFIDSSDFEDALLNICINAMHAIDSMGRLTITSSNQTLTKIKIEAEQLQCGPGDYVLLSITDTGCGMDEITCEKIFDPFFSTKGESGTGLGLSQVYGFIERSKGAINVHSKINSGTRFDLYFPRFQGATSVDKNDKNDKKQKLTGTETILIVDDELAILALTSEILTRHGYSVIKAESAKEALKILEKETIDLILSDVIMPEMDGYQLAAIVQEMYPTIKIQLASGFSDTRHLEMVGEPLHVDMLQKPFESHELLTKIRQLLSD